MNAIEKIESSFACRLTILDIACIEDSPSIHIGKMDGVPDIDRTTYITIGLSEHTLSLRQEKGFVFVRQELLTTVKGSEHEICAATMLLDYARSALADHRAYFDREAVRIPVVFNDKNEPADFPGAVCIAPPFWEGEQYFKTQQIKGDNFDPDYVYLMPIFQSEVELFRSMGSERFFSDLEASDIDITDPFRDAFDCNSEELPPDSA